MAAYKEEAGAILQPGNQINRLSSYNTEGVYGWPGAEAFELSPTHPARRQWALVPRVF